MRLTFLTRQSRVSAARRWWRRRAARIYVVTGVVLLAIVAFAARADAMAATSVAVASNVATVLSNIRAWIMGILAGLATLFLTIGGVRYVMAAGDPVEVEKAKTAFKSAAIGYALAALAPLVVSVLKGFVGA
jgi:hypothetical protein